MIIITIIKSLANPGRLVSALLLKGDAYSREGAYFILNRKPNLQSCPLYSLLLKWNNDKASAETNIRRMFC